MTVIMDVSAVMQILLRKEKFEKFHKIFQEATLVIAPNLYVPELTNALWKYFAAKIFTKNECEQYIQEGINFVDAFIDSKELWEEAFSEGINYQHSMYDMFYMVAARRKGGTLLTNDSDLAAICKKAHVQVVC